MTDKVKNDAIVNTAKSKSHKDEYSYLIEKI